jgi:hypothetical protein
MVNIFHAKMILQFGAAVYNAKELTRFASEHTQQLVELEMKALMNDVRYVLVAVINTFNKLTLYSAHENLKRSMKNVGTLVKSALGRQTVNGVLTQAEVEVPTLGPNARRATVDKFGVLSSLRISIQQARPGKLGRFKSLFVLNILISSASA